MISDAWRERAPGPVSQPTVWRIDLALDDERLARCRGMLSEAERDRADRFVRIEDRRRFVVSHAALRAILAGALHRDPSDLDFETGPEGKPELADRWRGRLRFNLSHSDELALVGVAPSGRIGVDIETIRPMGDALRIARGHFAASEIATLEARSADALTEAFFACWTRKEAFVKATGLGLSMPLNRFAVSIPPERAALLSVDGQDVSHLWTLHHLASAPAYIGAVAIEADRATCDLCVLPPLWDSRRLR